VHRVVPTGRALDSALALARELAALPQACLRSDRLSVRAQSGRPFAEAMAEEFRLGRATLDSGSAARGGQAFARRDRTRPR
jgi:enoyl-CoA hydratase